MRKIHTAYLWLTLVILTVSCTTDTLDPNDYRDPHIPKDNTMVLRVGTFAMSESEQAGLIDVEVDKVIYAATSPFVSSLAVGNIIVNPFGGENGFIRRIESIQTSGDQVIVHTSGAQMTEAFSAWVIDTRSDKLTIKARSSWGETFDFKETYAGVDFTFGSTVDPQFVVDASYSDYQVNYRWEEDDPFYLNGPYLELILDSFMISFTGKVIMSFHGDFSYGGALEPPVTITQIPYFNFLTLYAAPKFEVTGGFEGTYTSPTLGTQFGPYNLSCGYDNETARLFWRDQPIPALTPIFELPRIDNLSGEFKPNMGVEFIVAFTGQYETGVSELAEAKLSLYAYEYMNFIFLHRGNFDDRQPRISFDAVMGAGFNFGVEFNAFDGAVSSSLSSDDYEYQWYQWNIGNLNTCDQFPSADLTYSGGLVDIGLGSGPDHGAGFKIYVNDVLFDDLLYEYDQTHTIMLPSSNSLVNKISIVDEDSLGCYLEDIYVDPSLVGNCDNKFIDPRDGNEYCITDIGGVTWMSENLRYTGGGTIGKWYNNADTDENLVYGRLYTHAEIGNICPAGWHLPGNGEWNIMIDQLGGPDEFGKNAKAASSVLWPASELPDVTTFGAVPAGEYYAWLEGSTQYSAFGNRGKFARFWSSTMLDGSPTMFEIGAGNESDRHTGESASLIGLSQFKSIREIGFSCRCVQD